MTILTYKFLIFLTSRHKNKFFKNTIEIFDLIYDFHPLFLTFIIRVIRSKSSFKSILSPILKLDLIQFWFSDQNRMRSRIVLDLVQNLWKNFGVKFVFVFCLGFCIQLCFYFWKVLSVHLSQRWFCNLFGHRTFLVRFICWSEEQLSLLWSQVSILVADCFYSILTQELLLHLTTVFLHFVLTFKKIFYSLYRFT